MGGINCRVLLFFFIRAICFTIPTKVLLAAVLKPFRFALFYDV